MKHQVIERGAYPKLDSPLLPGKEGSTGCRTGGAGLEGLLNPSQWKSQRELKILVLYNGVKWAAPANGPKGFTIPPHHPP